MRKLYYLLSILFVATVAFAAGVGDDTFIIGKPGSSANKEIQFRGSPRAIRDNLSTGKLEFTQDGTTYKAIGSGTGGGAGGDNYLAELNGDFEAGTPPDEWITSGSITFTSETASPIGSSTSVQSGSADSGGAAVLRSALVDVPDGADGKLCAAKFEYQWVGGTAGQLIASVVNGSDTDIAVFNDIQPTTGTLVKKAFSPFFSCNLASQIQLKLEWLSDQPELVIDEAFLGSELGVTRGVAKNVVEAKVLGTTVTENNTTIADLSFIGDLEVGKSYNITLNAYLTSSDGNVVSARIRHNGLTLCQVIHENNQGAGDDESAGSCSYTFTAATTDVTIETAGMVVGGGQDRLLAGSSSILEKRNDLAGDYDEALTVETTGWNVNALIAGADPSLGLVAVPSPSEITNGSLSLTNYGKIDAKIGCSGTNAATGTTCSSGNEGVAISFEAPTSGDALVCLNVNHTFRIASNSNLATFFRLVKTNNATQTIVQGNRARILSSGDTDGSTSQFDQTNPFRICEIFNLDVGENTLRLFYSQSVAGTTSINVITAPFNFTVIPVNQGFPTPVFEGLQNSLNSKIETTADNTRLETVAVNCDGSSTFTEDGDWITSVSNISNGACTITFDPGIFSDDPKCTASRTSPFGSPTSFTVTSATSSSVTIDCAFSSSGSDCVSINYDLFCKGPK